MRVLLDTNVLLDLLAKRPDFYIDAVKLQAMAYFGDIELWASVKSFTDVFYIMSRTHNSAEIQRGILACDKFIKLCSIDGQDVMSAAREQWEDFEDCLIHRAAQKVKADIIITRNEDDFSKSSIRICTPHDFVIMMERDYNLLYDELVA